MMADPDQWWDAQSPERKSSIQRWLSKENLNAYGAPPKVPGQLALDDLDQESTNVESGEKRR